MSSNNNMTVAGGMADWVKPQNLADAIKLAEIMAQSDLVPKDYKGKAGNCIVAMQMGAELGLAPMQAIQNISVINGRPSVWGDAALAMVLAHPECEGIEETFEADDPVYGPMAHCTVKRRGREPVTESFSKTDAERAGLWKKQGPWQQYPKRMLKYRARAFALRDSFADVLKGLSLAEEARDIPGEDIKPAEATVVEGDTRSEQLANMLSAGDAVVVEVPDENELAEAKKLKWDHIEELVVLLSAKTGQPVTEIETNITNSAGKPFLSFSLAEFEKVETWLGKTLEEEKAS